MITFERAKKAVSTLHKRGWWVDATKEDLDFIAKKRVDDAKLVEDAIIKSYEGGTLHPSLINAAKKVEAERKK